jgi:hypothetical protein
VLHVGNGDDRWLGFFIEVRTPRQQGVVHHVDGVAMFIFGVCRCQKCRCKSCISFRVATSGRSPRHGMGSNDSADPLHQEFRSCSDKSVD